MSRILLILFSVVIFIGGLALGIYFSEQNLAQITPDSEILTKQIQDIVISQVQAEQNAKYNIEEVNAEEKAKISPYAKLVVEKYFKKCKHTTVDIIDVPKELVNLTEGELKQKYNKWEIKSFDNKEISIYREIDANCSSHYVIKDDDGYLAIYSQLTDDIIELKEKTEIEVASLREEDKKALEAGVKIYGNAELSSFIEDFNS